MLRILVSEPAASQWGGRIAQVLEGVPHVLVSPQAGVAPDADIAFVSRDVTGRSTKHEVLPDTQRFYDALLQSPRLRWVQLHAAGADRPVFIELRRRGVQVTTASGANAHVVAQSALAGILALTRRLPLLLRAQAERRWSPLLGPELTPRDLQGQRALVVGWGPIGQHLARFLQCLGVQVMVARWGDAPAGPDLPTVSYGQIHRLLPQADWLVLACPLSDATENLIDDHALSLLPARACVVNVSRGEVIDQSALVAALQAGRLAGAFLDVFAHEPLPVDSPVWSLPQVIATPHSAGFADSNAARVADMFLDNLARWRDGQPLLRLVTDLP